MSSKNVKEALKILKMIKSEIPRTMGEVNINLIYDDISQAISLLERPGDTKTKE